MKAIVLHIKPYSFKDEKTNRQVEGLSVHYLPTETLDPLTEQNGTRGYLPVKETLMISEYEKFPSVPAVYELDYYTVSTGRGIIQKLKSAKYICEIGGEVKFKPKSA